jgi:nucleotide-binding universal stress UspA family protein
VGMRKSHGKSEKSAKPAAALTVRREQTKGRAARPPSARGSQRRAFTVVVATDGSAGARAALTAATVFPWPAGTHGTGVVSRPIVPAKYPIAAWPALDEVVKRIAAGAKRVLVRRWPDAEVAVVSGPTAQAILAEAKRRRAGVIVVGARGHGALSRLLLGSVSRGVVREAICPVLVVKRPLARLDGVVVGLDGSAHSRRAAGFLASLRPPRGTRVTVLRVVEPQMIPSLGLLPRGVRRAIAGQAAALRAGQLRTARVDVETTVVKLRRAGWQAQGILRTGLPFPGLLDIVRTSQAGLLVLGARGAGGVERLLLGSVAETALDRCPVSVLLVR